MSVKGIEIKEDKTLKEFLDELKLTPPLLLEVNGEVFYPEDNYGKVLKPGDRVTVIPLIAGG